MVKSQRALEDRSKRSDDVVSCGLLGQLELIIATLFPMLIAAMLALSPGMFELVVMRMQDVRALLSHRERVPSVPALWSGPRIVCYLKGRYE